MDYNDNVTILSFFYLNSICIANVMESFSFHVCFSCFLFFSLLFFSVRISAIMCCCFNFVRVFLACFVTIDTHCIKRKKNEKKIAIEPNRRASMSLGNIFYCWSIFHCFRFSCFPFCSRNKIQKK